MNLKDIFKLPQSTPEERTIKRMKYLELMEKAVDDENYELAIICRDNIRELKL